MIETPLTIDMDGRGGLVSVLQVEYVTHGIVLNKYILCAFAFFFYLLLLS